jgi:membrane protease subunit (stomatin/prohibitin family)
MQATYGNAANDAMLAAKANAAAEDPAAKLKKLGEMRDSGLINDDEFAAKKAELLAEM